MHLLIRGTEAILIGFDLFNNVALNTCIDKTGGSIRCNREQISNVSTVKMIMISVAIEEKTDSVQSTLAESFSAFFQEYILEITQFPILIRGIITTYELSFIGSELSFLLQELSFPEDKLSFVKVN